MLKPPLPDDEDSRIGELRRLGILDSLPQERFDRYTRLVRRLLDVPIALISLVDSDRQWFLSRQGLEARETPRDVSFCGHAILNDQPLVIEDATKDARFQDNPLVTDDPNVRFYAGFPLPGPLGGRLGTLCVIDRHPRTLDPEDLEALCDIGAMVAGELASLQLATTDELTGLSNRRGFEVLAGQTIAMCRRAGSPATVVMIDMDGFKSINDQFGHEVGDQALVEFSGLLLDHFRESDVIARLGGDEFCALLAASDEAHAWLALHRLQQTVNRRNLEPVSRFPLAFTGGVAEYRPSGHRDIMQTLRDADESMYHRKRQKL